jgi:hypothetical protein
MEVKHQKRRSQQHSGLLTLPSDLLQLVLELLGVAELARRLRPVCRAASAFVARCPAVALQAYSLTASALDSLFRCLDTSRLTSLRLRIDSKIDLSFSECSFPVLEALWLSSQRLSNHGLETVISAAPRLQSLKLTRCYCLTSGLFNSLAKLNRLRCLWWSRPMCQTGLRREDGWLPKFSLLEFGARYCIGGYENSYLSEFGAAFANVEVLGIKATSQPIALERVLEQMRRLRLLRVDNVLGTGSKQWAIRLFDACPSLQRLDIRKFYVHDIEDPTRSMWIRESEGVRCQHEAVVLGAPWR